MNLLPLPFYENLGDGRQCLQVALKIVIKYFLDKEYALEELDRLTNRKPDGWTFSTQGIVVLTDLGLNVEYYTKSELQPFTQGPDYWKKFYGEETFNQIMKFVDVTSGIDSIKKVIAQNIFHKRPLTINDLKEFIEKEYAVIVAVDNSILNNHENPEYIGHFVVLTGIDKESVYFHDSGPECIQPNRKIKIEHFLKSWDNTGTDMDTIVIKGKK